MLMSTNMIRNEKRDIWSIERKNKSVSVNILIHHSVKEGTVGGARARMMSISLRLR